MNDLLVCYEIFSQVESSAVAVLGVKNTALKLIKRKKKKNSYFLENESKKLILKVF